MTYNTIEISNRFDNETYRHVNIRNLGFARTLAERLSIGERTADVIDQTTGAVVSTYSNGVPTYMDWDPYAGY